MFFLDDLALTGTKLAAGGAIFALIMAFILVFIIIVIGLYVYSSFAYMAIARKAKYPSPGIAWIPAVGPLIITSKVAKMHWWPILLLLGYFIPFIGTICSLAVAVFSIIWLWKTFEVVGRRLGWWAIMTLIPIVGLVFLGIAALGKSW